MKINQNMKPPKWIVKLFVWLSKPAEVDDLLGDMEEIYSSDIIKKSVRYANLKYMQHAITLLFSYTIKKRKKIKNSPGQNSIQNNFSMYQNYFKMVFRGLRKQLSFTTINVLGLGAGLGLCFIIVLYVQSELSYDQFHKDADRIHRITKSYKVGEKEVETSRLRSYLTPAIKENIPAVQDYSSIKRIEEPLSFQIDEKEFEENRVALVDSNFFSFFTFEILEGNPQKVLEEPSSIAISRSMASKYFKSSDPLNQVLEIALKSNKDKSFKAKVTGVFEDMPVNSHFHLDFLLSKNTAVADARAMGFRGLVMQHNYIKLLPQQDINEVDIRLPYIEENYAPSFYKTADMHLHTQALTDIHLKSNLENELEANGNIQYVYLLSLVGIFILVIASFNYMNLATSNALERAKEVGVRKVMGSRRGQLIVRFFTESILVTLIAFFLALGIVYISLPYFNNMAGKTLNFGLLENFETILLFLSMAIAVGLLSGAYPALYLSKFKAVKSLKGTVSKHGKGTKLFRKTLVTTQFVISVVLIICTIVVLGQLEYLKTKDLGYNTDTIISIGAEDETVNGSYQVIKQELLSNPNIVAVAGSNRELVTDFDLGVTNGITVPGIVEPVAMNYVFVDEDFFDLYDIQLSKGHNFKNMNSRNTDVIILNETAVERIRSTEEEVLETNLKLYGDFAPKVIGVVNDFHFESLYKEVGPVYFQLFKTDNTQQRLKYISVKVSSENLASTLGSIESFFKKQFPSLDFDYRFLDEKIEKAYEKERRFTSVFGLFSGLAIFMACLGVLGLAIQTAASKQKEISVRKVLGASVLNLVNILTKEVMLLVLLANIIAWPIAYLGMNRWLQDFPYRDTIQVELFLPVLLATLLITFFSVVFKVIQAATINPSKSLKME